MFGLFKPKLAPQGPVEFQCDIEIAAPASEVYALINWADPRNAKRALGNEVTAVDGDEERYELVLHNVPGHTFHIEVIHAVPNREYVFDCMVDPVIGAMQSTRETYRIEPVDEQSCVLTLINETQFAEGLRMREFQCHVGQMAASSQSALEKLRIQAEFGLDALKSVEDRLVI
ncbi:MAG: SRPBCC family protein [Alteripontixanthobacter sp.]